MAYNVQLKKSNGSLYEDVYVATKWSLISDKPSTFTPTSHNHTASDIIGGISISNIGTGSASNDLIVGTPEGSLGFLSRSTFSLSTHDHSANDITSGEFNRLRIREILSKDTRNTVDEPSSNLAGARFDFKSTTASDLVDGGSYNGIMTYRPYGNTSSDFSGGPSHQLGFSGGGNLHHRIGDGSGWNSWKKIAYADDIPTTFSASNITSGELSSSRLPTVPVSKGGTGRTTLTSNYVLAGNGTSSVQLLSRSGIDTRTSFPTDTMKLIRGRSNNGALTGVGSGDNLGLVALDESVTWGDTLFIEVLGKTGSASYTPKIVPITLRPNTTTPNTTTEYYTASFSTFNGTNFIVYSFSVSASGSELYFGSKKILTGVFSGTTINWYTNTYTLYVGRVWKV